MARLYGLNLLHFSDTSAMSRRARRGRSVLRRENRVLLKRREILKTVGFPRHGVAVSEKFESRGDVICPDRETTTNVSGRMEARLGHCQAARTYSRGETSRRSASRDSHILLV
jgi:hypothetical protein